MRYFVQFVIPAIIFMALVYFIGRRRGQTDRDRGGDTPIVSNTTFVLCLVVGATVAVASLFALAEL